MSERVYHDMDGEEVSLDTLCRREPAWAANCIRTLESEIKRLGVEVDTICAHLAKRSEDNCRLGVEVERLRKIINCLKVDESVSAEFRRALDGDLA